MTTISLDYDTETGFVLKLAHTQRVLTNKTVAKMHTVSANAGSVDVHIELTDKDLEVLAKALTEALKHA